VAFFSKNNNKYESEKYELFLKKYSNRAVNEYHNSDYFETLFDYDFSGLLLIVFFLITGVSVFYSEKQNDTVKILKSSIKGKSKISYVKIVAFIIFIFIISVLFFTSDVIAHSFYYHLDGWGNPVYAIKSYEFCSFSGSILSYYLLLCLSKITALIFYGLLFLLITVLFNGLILPIVVNGLALLSTLILSENYMETTIFSLANPAILMQPADLNIGFETIKIFNTPYLTINVSLTIMILLNVLISILIYTSYKYNLVVKTPHLGGKYAENRT
jgi:hypothetical protein